jgi:hypothetical protein
VLAPVPRSELIGPAVRRWLLASDPSIRWKVLRDLTDAPADEVAAQRARVATEGAGARLLALQAPDGRWGRGIVDRLLVEQLPDGGWNCEATSGSTRSSFNTTICALEAPDGATWQGDSWAERPTVDRSRSVGVGSSGSKKARFAISGNTDKETWFSQLGIPGEPRP